MGIIHDKGARNKPRGRGANGADCGMVRAYVGRMIMGMPRADEHRCGAFAV